MKKCFFFIIKELLLKVCEDIRIGITVGQDPPLLWFTQQISALLMDKIQSGKKLTHDFESFSSQARRARQWAIKLWARETCVTDSISLLVKSSWTSLMNNMSYVSLVSFPLINRTTWKESLSIRTWERNLGIACSPSLIAIDSSQ